MLQVCDEILITNRPNKCSGQSKINYRAQLITTYRNERKVCGLFSPVVYWAGAEVLWLREVSVNEVLLCRVYEAERRNSAEFK